MENVKKIRVIVGTAKTKDGRTFNTYKAVQKGGHLCDCKFRKEVKNLPEKACIMVVKKDNINMQKNSLYPVLWVKAVESYEELPSSTNTVDELFD